MSTVSFFLPVRAGSERVLNKNTKPFADIEGGLLANKLRQISQSRNIAEIILSTNDPDCIEVGERFASTDKRIRVILRPDELCSSQTNLQDLIRYVATVTNCEHVLWGHVTTPLVHAPLYDEAIECYRNALRDGFDSLVSVSRFQNFLLNDAGQMVNNSTKLPWPRTQDLTPLYEINHAMFMAPRQLYAQGQRTGVHPKLYQFEKIRAYDIDWPEDFVVCEQLYFYFIKNAIAV